MKSAFENKLQQTLHSAAPKMHSEAERQQMWSTIQKNIPAQPAADKKPAARTKRLGIAGLALITFFGAAAFTSAVMYINKPDHIDKAVIERPAVFPPHRPAAAEQPDALPQPEPVQAESKVPEASVLSSKFSPASAAEERTALSASAAPAVPPAPVVAVEPVLAEEMTSPAADSSSTAIVPPAPVSAKADKVPVVVKKPVVVNNDEVKVVKVKSKFSKQAK